MDLSANFMDGAGGDRVITLDEMRAFRDKKIVEDGEVGYLVT